MTDAQIRGATLPIPTQIATLTRPSGRIAAERVS
jgi:hypothetical protein